MLRNRIPVLEHSRPLQASPVEGIQWSWRATEPLGDQAPLRMASHAQSASEVAVSTARTLSEAIPRNASRS